MPSHCHTVDSQFISVHLAVMNAMSKAFSTLEGFKSLLDLELYNFGALVSFRLAAPTSIWAFAQPQYLMFKEHVSLSQPNHMTWHAANMVYTNMLLNPVLPLACDVTNSWQVVLSWLTGILCLLLLLCWAWHKSSIAYPWPLYLQILWNLFGCMVSLTLSNLFKHLAHQ